MNGGGEQRTESRRRVLGLLTSTATALASGWQHPQQPPQPRRDTHPQHRRASRTNGWKLTLISGSLDELLPEYLVYWDNLAPRGRDLITQIATSNTTMRVIQQTGTKYTVENPFHGKVYYRDEIYALHEPTGTYVAVSLSMDPAPPSRQFRVTAQRTVADVPEAHIITSDALTPMDQRILTGATQHAGDQRIVTYPDQQAVDASRLVPSATDTTYVRYNDTLWKLEISTVDRYNYRYTIKQIGTTPDEFYTYMTAKYLMDFDQKDLRPSEREILNKASGDGYTEYDDISAGFKRLIDRFQAHRSDSIAYKEWLIKYSNTYSIARLAEILTQ